MTAPTGTQVTPAELRALDAQYRPFPDFQTFCAAVAVDTDLWERIAAGLQQKRTDASADFDRAVEVALRAAAVDTGAIEGLYKVDRGFTVTVAEEQPGWEAEADKKGAAFRQLFASQLRGYELALELAAGDTPINEAWIRELHSEITAGQPTYQAWIPTLERYQQQVLPRGQYKTRPNHVRRADGGCHAYAPVDDVPMEMQRLLEQMRSPEFGAAHPSLQAAYAHYALVVIHPFADGNGRVARAIASASLIKSCGVPLVIWSDQDDEYLNALSVADRGNYQTFVDFMFHCAIQATQLITGYLTPSIEQQAEALQGTIALLSELSQQELWRIGSELLGSLERRVQSILDGTELPEGVDTSFSWFDLTASADADIEGYREVGYEESTMLGRKTMFDIDLSTEVLARTCTVTVSLRVLANKGAPIYPLLIQSLETPDLFLIRLADFYPVETTGLKRRLDAWLRGLISEALGQLTEEAEQSLREAHS